ncbi:MAG: type II toxin-antitoxin system HicA family toxin [Cyanobacteriota bacterium]|nr:type II toxin-antitoxin system HicA family toxin [Cyanobacteriota bacterium]
MGKLKVLSAKEVCKILDKGGFVEVRVRGSHIIMQLRTENSTVTVPVPNYKEIRIGTLQSIIRQSGLPRYEFEVD